MTRGPDNQRNPLAKAELSLGSGFETAGDKEDNKLKVITFGCRLNAYESEVIRTQAKAQGVTNTIVFNSCAVTAEAERQVRQAIRKARRDHPEARIVVTGCAAQINPTAFAAMSEVDEVLGNSEKMAPAALVVREKAPRIRVGAIADLRETAGHLMQGFDGRSRAFLQVQQGCDHACTFCIIPLGRGKSRSLPVGDIIKQAELLVLHGVKEIVLTGVDMTAYGRDLPGNPTLGQLCRTLLASIPALPRLRLSSVDPSEIDYDILGLLGEESRFMPHLHLSVQAGADLILKRMKRRHLRLDVLNLCDQARKIRSDIVFGADLITGFPTETDDHFNDTYRLVEEAGLTYLHVFPYSERPGTPAARMPQVPKELRKARAQLLRDLGKRQLSCFLDSRLGKVAEVLIEKQNLSKDEVVQSGAFEALGHDTHFAPVRCSGQLGEIIRLKLVRHDGEAFEGAPYS